MKLAALVSIVALTAATAAFAQSKPPLAGENPNNCSAANPNCATTGDASNKTPRNVQGNEQKQGSGAMVNGTAGATNNPNNCSAANPNCAMTGDASNKTPRNAQGNEQREQGAMAPSAPSASPNIKAGTKCPPGQSACASQPPSERGTDSGSASRGAQN